MCSHWAGCNLPKPLSATKSGWTNVSDSMPGSSRRRAGSGGGEDLLPCSGTGKQLGQVWVHQNSSRTFSFSWQTQFKGQSIRPVDQATSKMNKNFSFLNPNVSLQSIEYYSTCVVRRKENIAMSVSDHTDRNLCFQVLLVDQLHLPWIDLALTFQQGNWFLQALEWIVSGILQIGL